MIDRLSDLAPPAPLDQSHEVAQFSSGEAALDEWLKRRALDNMRLAASRTYVVCSKDTRRVAGFYALAMGQIANRGAAGSMRRNMPAHIPAVILARLAVDREFQRAGLGRALLADAISRSLRAATEVSARLVVVHAISTNAEAFYLRHGFVRLPMETPTLALDLVKLARLSSGAPEGAGL